MLDLPCYIFPLTSLHAVWPLIPLCYYICQMLDPFGSADNSLSSSCQSIDQALDRWVVMLCVVCVDLYLWFFKFIFRTSVINSDKICTHTSKQRLSSKFVISVKGPCLSWLCGKRNRVTLLLPWRQNSYLDAWIPLLSWEKEREREKQTGWVGDRKA